MGSNPIEARILSGFFLCNFFNCNSLQGSFLKLNAILLSFLITHSFVFGRLLPMVEQEKWLTQINKYLFLINDIEMLYFLNFLGLRPASKWIQVLTTKQIPKGGTLQIIFLKMNIVKCLTRRSFLIFDTFDVWLFQVTPKKGSVTKSARKKRRSSFVRGRKERKSLVFSSAPSGKSGRLLLLWVIKVITVCKHQAFGQNGNEGTPQSWGILLESLSTVFPFSNLKYLFSFFLTQTLTAFKQL